ncbi:hypothetical protein P8X34_11045 [Pyrococcus kukulkanii]|uniref:Uncharacterized protein n=1 Tax=Pyrococcus kukulkanii TaxID=1609559 RepID=A0ABV4T8G1_9EURY
MLCARESSWGRMLLAVPTGSAKEIDGPEAFGVSNLALAIEMLNSVFAKEVLKLA